jgi:hypothetical protein
MSSQTRRRLVGVIFTLALTECGTSSVSADGPLVGADAAPAADGAKTDAPAPFSGSTPLGFGQNVNNRCLAFALPPNCHMVLTGVDAGCGQPGLSPAAPADIAAIAATPVGSSAPPGATCQVTELMSNCTDRAPSGWCYVQGSCSPDAGSNCDQSICASSGFSLTQGHGFYVAVLICP